MPSAVKSITWSCEKPSATHARPAARLLHKLRPLERQRRGQALLGRCLRLGARLGARLLHLGRLARSAAHGTRREDKPNFTRPAELRFFVAHAATPAWRPQPCQPSADASTVRRTKPGQRSTGRTAAHWHEPQPACQAPRARAAAPPQSAAQLPPPPRPAPRCVRAAPRQTSVVSNACTS